MKYHKINSIFKRDLSINPSPLLMGQYSCPEFEYLANNEWEFTEKIDGTNIRLIFNGEKIEIAGRTDKAQIPSFLFNFLSEMTANILPVVKEIFPYASEESKVALFGEGCGFKIQKNGQKYTNNEKRNDFILFDILVNRTYLRRQDVVSIADKLNMCSAPIVGSGTIFEAIDLIRNGLKSTYGDFIAEGLVIRPIVELASRINGRIITKIKSCDKFKE